MALLVGRSRDRSPVVSLGIFSKAPDKSMCPGVDSASKNEYHDIPGGKGGRCVGVTTLPPSCAECQEIWEPNLLDTSRPRRPVMRIPYLTFKLRCTTYRPWACHSIVSKRQASKGSWFFLAGFQAGSGAR